MNFLYGFVFFMIGAVLWSLWINLVTWREPELSYTLEVMIYFSVIFILKVLFTISRKHLKSINSLDENKTITVKQHLFFRSEVQTVFNLDQLKISELNDNWFTSFKLNDRSNSVVISSSNHGVSAKKIKKIHKKLCAITHYAYST